MAGKRELILERIKSITIATKTGAGIITCVRNRALMSNEKRPACVLLDGDERPAVLKPNSHTDSRGGIRPAILRMSPELYVLMDEGRPNNDSYGPNADQNIGTVLNEKAILLSAAIMSDAELKALLGANGGAVYNGCVTDLKSGSALTGQMRLDFVYTYVFDPT